jgi:hypothetical protein
MEMPESIYIALSIVVLIAFFVFVAIKSREIFKVIVLVEIKSLRKANGEYDRLVANIKKGLMLGGLKLTDIGLTEEEFTQLKEKYWVAKAKKCLRFLRANQDNDLPRYRECHNYIISCLKKGKFTLREIGSCERELKEFCAKLIIRGINLDFEDVIKFLNEDSASGANRKVRVGYKELASMISGNAQN